MNEAEKNIKFKTRKPLLYISMVSMAMFFAGLTSGYIVRKGEGNWFEFDLPFYFSLSTLIILLSSFTIHKAILNAKSNNFSSVSNYLFFTLILGLMFSFFQFLGWRAMYDMGIYFTGKGSHASGSFVYAITLMHLMHIIAGLVTIFIMYLNSRNKRYSSNNVLGLELGATFWHFLDVLWIFLFVFLLVV